jgi:hypothetical protein
MSAVELTIRVRYPLPDYDPEYAAMGLETIEDVVREEILSLQHDPAELVELLDSGTTEVTYEFEIDDPDHAFTSGDATLAPSRGLDYSGLAPREFHLGDDA